MLENRLKSAKTYYLQIDKHFFAVSHCAMMISDSHKHQHKSISLNPFVSMGFGALITRFNLMGDYEKAIKTAQETIETFSNHTSFTYALAFAYVHLERFNLALKNIDIALQIDPSSELNAFKGYIHAKAGNRGKALEMLNQLEDNVHNQTVDFYDIASIYTTLGEADTAFEYLEKAYESKFSHIFLLKIDPRFASLRDDSRFISLLRRIGLI